MPEAESIVLPRWVCLSTCLLVDATLVHEHNTLPEWLRFPAHSLVCSYKGGWCGKTSCPWSTWRIALTSSCRVLSLNR